MPTSRFLLFFIFIFMSSNAYCTNMVCGSDLDSSGDINQDTEYKSCNLSSKTATSSADIYCLEGTLLYVEEMKKQVCKKTNTVSASYSCSQGIYNVATNTCDTTTTYSATLYCQMSASQLVTPGSTVNMGGGTLMVFEITPDRSRCGTMIIVGAGSGHGAGPYFPLVGKCNSGDTYVNGSCLKKGGTVPPIASCPSGYTQNGVFCVSEAVSDPLYKCPSGSTLVGSTCQSTTQEYYCPIQADSACLSSGGGASCSPNKCVDLDTAETENGGNIDGSMLTDDGARSEDGACLDQMYIFSGRAQDCKLAGMSTAFKNCCASDGKALADTAGSYLSASQKLSTIKTVYEAASRAYTAYTGATAAGATASAAAAQGVAAAQQYLMVAFDPTTLAISIAIYVVMKYLATACDQLSTETALLADSGYCHEVGTYCKKKIKFIGCVQKAKAYCCFNSKLARIIHEQGRPQLNTGINNWGTPENPLCRGFTPEEFQSVDFGKVDLTEYINDIQKNANEQIQATMQSITSDFIEQTH